MAVCLAIVIAGAICTSRAGNEPTQMPQGMPDDALFELSRVVTECVWVSPEMQVALPTPLT